MNYEIRDCIDAGTEYCPCHLAETGDCLTCSQLNGKTFCDCINWKGVCIYQEYIWNSGKAKQGRKIYSCKVAKKETVEKNIIVISISAPHELVKNLVHPGSYVFLRTPKTSQFYDVPISIMETNVDDNLLTVAIEVKGPKTKSINLLKENDVILVRGPYWNGDLGLRNIYRSREGTSVIIARGIGMAPMVPVMKKLYSNGNNIIVVLDKANYKNIFINKYLELCNCTVINCNTLQNGVISEELKNILNNLFENEKINLIHCSGPDILNYKVLEYIGDKVDFSCCNNAKMCCGEGVCGACSTRFKGHKVKKLCKVQIEPKYIFEGRRFI
ncbi:sulfide/dihydroorotate dehydrogenase-like FAD/NAD-binding protein [Clostridium swellfunianum]|uniref:sulfide/dihydroorotate dehydrogenase-like FAD/NAD-binding protein n=1 Tax=Clostridium swellfunianum TaxID=1367462 RepID=UPI002030FB02|nr:sulfide/dihydroorotate dehydrogenase-like FAD/NAD-binding protein [Clostridium swellfunianum]